MELMNKSFIVFIAVALVIFLGGEAMSSDYSMDSIRINKYWAEKSFFDMQADDTRISSSLPFSFVYGGKSSQELIASWQKQVSEERIGAGKISRTLKFLDPRTGLEVRAEVTQYTDTPGVDWILYFTNTGKADTPIIEQVKAADLSVLTNTQSSPVLHGINGCYPNNWLAFDRPIALDDSIKFGASNGASSESNSPFFNVGFEDGGVIAAIGWSGQWTGSIERDKDSGNIQIRAGMEFMHLKLHPGETIRSPRVLIVQYKGDEAHSYNMFRHTMFSHIMPKADGKLVVPPVVHMSTSFDELNFTDESSLLSHLKSLKGLGFEYFWLDAYFTKDGFPNGMGNYGVPMDKIAPDPVRFPNGLKPVADAVKRDGLKFLVWFEPERVAPGTLIAKEHPDYVIWTDKNASGLYNLGIPEARAYMTKALDDAVKSWNLGSIRFDYNISPLPFWQYENGKDPDRVGMTEIRYVEGLYQMWDDLLAANPCLFFDNCAGGGRRIDLETCSRSIPLWRTDNTISPLFNYDYDTAALLNQVMTAGLSRYVPFSTSGQMGAKPYQFRSGVNGGGITFAEDLRPFPQESAVKGRKSCGIPVKDMYGAKGYPRDQLHQAIVEAKRVRKYYYGDYYALSPLTASDNDWQVIQYHRTKENDGMIVAFRRPKSYYTSYECMLYDINKDARYEVTEYLGYKSSKPFIISGAELSKLEISIPDRPGSMIVEYKKVGK